MLKAGRDAEARGWELSKKTNTESLEQLKKGGLVVNSRRPQLEGRYEERGETLLAEWLKNAGAEGQALVDAYRK